MSEENITMDGVVIESQRGAKFNVELDNGHKMVCTISGKIRKNNIRIAMGDKVEVTISPYDLSLGRITFRHR